MLFGDFTWWKILWWAVGTIGVGGLIALCLLYPVVLAALWRLARLVFATRIGCAVVAAIIAALIADYVRHDIEDEKRKAEIAAFEQRQTERDVEIARDTREWVLKEIRDATPQDADTDKEVKDFTNALPPIFMPVPTAPASSPPRPSGNPFRVGDDADRLRRIYGQAGGGPHGAQGVPQADAGKARLRDRIRNRLSGSGSGSGRRTEQGQ